MALKGELLLKLCNNTFNLFRFSKEYIDHKIHSINYVWLYKQKALYIQSTYYINSVVWRSFSINSCQPSDEHYVYDDDDIAPCIKMWNIDKVLLTDQETRLFTLLCTLHKRVTLHTILWDI